MADGGRADSRQQKLDFSASEAKQMDRAARKVARMFGFGGAWEVACAYGSGDDESAQENNRLTVIHRGRVSEKAFAIVAGQKVRLGKRQHVWAAHRGISAIPVSAPVVEGIAALGFLRVGTTAVDLLIAYSCEDFGAWLRVERRLHLELPSSNALMAGRDAMARIMFRCAALSQDERARQLKTRAAAYREETAAAERFLRAWLVAAATAFNNQPNYTSPKAGASQGNGFRAQDLWRPCNETYQRRPKASGDGITPPERTKH